MNWAVLVAVVFGLLDVGLIAVLLVLRAHHRLRMRVGLFVESDQNGNDVVPASERPTEVREPGTTPSWGSD